MKSSNEIEKALYESSNSSISITKKDGKYFNVNQFKDIEKLKEIEEKIMIQQIFIRRMAAAFGQFLMIFVCNQRAVDYFFEFF